MSKSTLNVGSAANAGDGDPLRTAAQKIEANFVEIYAEFGDGTNLSNGNTTGQILVADGTKYVNKTQSGDVTIIASGASTIKTDVALAGNPTTTTQSAGNNSTRIATTAYADSAVSAVIDSAPDALNTLNELAAALDDTANYAATITTALGTKLVKASNLDDLGSASESVINLGINATATELNIMDGSATNQATVTLLGTDGVVISDADEMKQALVSDFDTYVSGTTKTLTNKTLTSPVLNTGVSGTAILDEDTLSSNSATQLATQQSIKAYVDATVTAQDLDLTDGTTAIDIDLDSESLSILGGTGITSTASGTGVTLALTAGGIATASVADDAITSPKLALFDDSAAATNTHILVADGTDFVNVAISGDATLANNGALTIAAGAIENSMLADDAVDSDELAAGSVDAAHMSANSIDSASYVDASIDTAHYAAGSVDATALGADCVTAAKIGDDVINSEHYAAASIDNEHLADNAVDSDELAAGAVDTAHIADDNITHAKLENRYTAINAISSTSGAFNIDWSLGAIHTLVLGGNHTGTFINFKVGQVIDITTSGDHTLTFDATSSGTAAIRKAGGIDFDGSATQIIQVVCASADSTTPIFYYTVNTWAVDTIP